MGLKHHYWRRERLSNLVEAGDAFLEFGQPSFDLRQPRVWFRSGQAGELALNHHIIIVAGEHELFPVRLVDRRAGTRRCLTSWASAAKIATWVSAAEA